LKISGVTGEFISAYASIDVGAFVLDGGRKRYTCGIFPVNFGVVAEVGKACMREVAEGLVSLFSDDGSATAFLDGRGSVFNFV
jgi:hypothetical protein